MRYDRVWLVSDGRRTTLNGLSGRRKAGIPSQPKTCALSVSEDPARSQGQARCIFFPTPLKNV